MNTQVLTHLKELLDHVEYYNNMAPFPPYDTEWVQEIKNRIKEMEDNKETNYDDEPVWACKYCKHLDIRIDTDSHGVENDVCMRCGSQNEIIKFENIYEYKKFKDGNS